MEPRKPVGGSVEPLIFAIRGASVIFAFLLSAEETVDLRSQIVTSKENAAVNQSDSRIEQRTLNRRGGPRYRPWAFSEHGALMAANVLRTEAAVQMSIFVIRAFVRLREQVAANAAILKRLAEIDQTLLQHDTALRDVYRKLQPLLAPPAESRKRRIGF